MFSVLESSLSDSDKVKQVEKLHKQFGHVSTENLKRLIKNTGEQDAGLMKIIDEVVQACDVCRKYKKPVPRPIVGLSRAENFNHSVALDLHELGPNLWYLHMIDEFTRFSNAVLIKEKYPVVIIRIFLKFWVSIFGDLKRYSVTTEENLLEKNFMKCVKHSVSKYQVPHPIHHGAMDCVRDIIEH